MIPCLHPIVNYSGENHRHLQDAPAQTGCRPTRRRCPRLHPLTTIRVHYNTGLANSIWIRGSQYPFWWDDGRSMRWTTGDVWVWETTNIGEGTQFEFKPLKNDTTWSQGNNFWSRGGLTVEIYPSFP